MAGWTVVPNLDPASAWTPVSPAAPAPSTQRAIIPPENTISAAPPPSILDRLRGTVANSAVGHSLEQVLPKIADALNLHPTETVNSPTYESDKQNFIAPQYLMPSNPQTQAGQKAKALLTGMGNVLSPRVLAPGVAIAATAGLAAPLAPVAIPMTLGIGGVGLGGTAAIKHASQAQSQYNQGNVDAGNDATSNLPGDLAMMLGSGAIKIPGEGTVPGENFTPTQLKAHAGILGRMNGLGDNFIPQDSAASTGSVIRQAAADNPTIAKAATVKGSTPNNIAALQAILQKANTALEAPHAATIAQHAAVPADVTGVQSAVGQSFPQSLSGVSPEDTAAIQQLQQRLGTVNTLGGLNDLRQWLNDEAAAGYKQDGVAASRGTATKAGIRTAADAARDAYYDQLQQASGVDFRPIKAQQSALLDQQEGAAKLGQTLSAQQAVADAPKSRPAKLAEAITGGRALKAGPVAGIAQLAAESILRQKPLTQPNYLIRKFLSNLPDPTPPDPSTTQGVAPVTTNAPRLPATASPTTLVGTPVNPSPQAPPTLQLPAALQRLLPQATSDGGVPAYQQPVPPPPVNPSTATTRIAPTQFTTPEVTPALTRPVTPSGQVLTPLQRFLQAGDLEKSIDNPSTDDLKRAILKMRSKKR